MGETVGLLPVSVRRGGFAMNASFGFRGMPFLHPVDVRVLDEMAPNCIPGEADSADWLPRSYR